ncbi:MAG: glycosyltransferase [Planctomycetes bacterium]|nr:glycosyltransferase [Planctomycetota bacterium]
MKVLVVTAMYPKPGNPAFGSFVSTQVESLRQSGVEVELLVLSGKMRKLIYPKGVIQLRRRLADRSIDLVHAHYGYVGMVARTQWQLPVVVTFHGDDLMGTIGPQGQRRHFSRLVGRASQALANRVDAVIVQNRQMASLIPKANAHIIPHEIDFDVFQHTPKGQARTILGLDPSRKYLLFAANPTIPVKRYPLAQAVAEHLGREDSGIELLVVHTETQPRLALYMSACDALVFPSYQEGSPNVVKQAMACNLPIVATDVGDIREVIGGTAGCYVCDPTVEAFAHSVRQILQTCERTQGRDDVQQFDTPIIARRVIDLYESVLSKKNRLDRASGMSVGPPSRKFNAESRCSARKQYDDCG